MKLFLGFRVNTRRSGFATGQVSSAAMPDHWLSREPTSQAVKNAARCHGIHTVDTGH
jgi:hypothetical protein